MEETIAGMSSDELLAAMESNMVAFWSAYGCASGSTWRATPGVAWYYTGVPEPLFNGVLAPRLQPDEVRAVVNGLQAKIDESGAPALWWIGPQATPAQLGSLLLSYGLKPAGAVPGLAVDLGSVDGEPEALAGLRIQKADSPELRALWGRISCVGSEFPDDVADAVERLGASLTQAQGQSLYVGFIGDAPVATSAMVLDSDVAGIYAVATIPEARHKGIGRAMTVIPLLEARQLGYRVGVLQASSMGYPIYRKIGFEDVCTYRLYLQS